MTDTAKALYKAYSQASRIEYHARQSGRVRAKLYDVAALSKARRLACKALGDYLEDDLWAYGAKKSEGAFAYDAPRLAHWLSKPLETRLDALRYAKERMWEQGQIYRFKPARLNTKAIYNIYYG